MQEHRNAGRLRCMPRPIFVQSLTDHERQALHAGLRSADAFTVRRCQILLASADGKVAATIAADLYCDDQTVRNAIHAFNRSWADRLAKDEA